MEFSFGLQRSVPARGAAREGATQVLGLFGQVLIMENLHGNAQDADKHAWVARLRALTLPGPSSEERVHDVFSTFAARPENWNMHPDLLTVVRAKLLQLWYLEEWAPAEQYHQRIFGRSIAAGPPS